MNPDTRVAICCYQGDAHQVEAMLETHLRHECPITILSPEDSPVYIQGADARMGGKRCYIGTEAIYRMRKHLEILLTYPENRFLIHDADSILLDAEIPEYVRKEPDVLWSSVVFNTTPEQQSYYPEGFPHIAFHPPWIMSRAVIERLLAIPDEINPKMLFIDYWLVDLAIKAGVPSCSFHHAISYPTAEPFWAGAAWDAVRYRGTAFVHSVKTNETCDLLKTARKLYLEDPHAQS